MCHGRRNIIKLVGIVATIGLTALGLLTTSTIAHATPTVGVAEAQFLTLVNTERVNASLSPMVSDPLIFPIAHDWSVSLANSQVLSHRPDLVASFDNRVTKSWTRIGENVGRGPDVQGLHNAFMNSPGHKANVLGDYNRIGIAVVIDSNGTIWVTFNFMKAAAITGPTGLAGSTPGGGFDAAALGPVTTAPLWMTTPEGNVLGFGGAPLFGNLTSTKLNQPIVGMTPTYDRKGYWMVATDGGIFAFGDAGFKGSTGNIRLNRPIVGMANTPTGNGYWLVASDGGIFSFGDAGFYGSTGAMTLNRPIVGMAPTPSGHGYWLVATDGGIFAFGDAAFYGSTGDKTLSSPIFAMGTSPGGHGYWLVGADGAIFSFGDAGYFGSTSGQSLTAPMARLIPTSTGLGYRLIGQDGRVYSFGDAGSGSTGIVPGLTQVVSAAPAT